MKNTQSNIKSIKIGKRPGTMYCFGCKDFTHNFRQQEVKMTNKVLREKSHCVVCWSNKPRFLTKTKTQQQKIILHFPNRCYKNKIKIAWSVEKILKILTQKCLKQKIID